MQIVVALSILSTIFAFQLPRKSLKSKLIYSSIKMSGNKRKIQDSLAEVSKDGKFVRTASKFRNIIGESEKYPAEANRYHL